jgi:hypothetical protein
MTFFAALLLLFLFMCGLASLAYGLAHVRESFAGLALALSGAFVICFTYWAITAN